MRRPAIPRLVCVIAVVAVAACRGAPDRERSSTLPVPAVPVAAAPSAAVMTPDPYVVLKENARALLEEPCGRCHISAYDTALPRALAIFDLSEADWSKTMSNEQLRNAYGRLNSKTLPGGKDNTISEKDKARFLEFVELEITRRGKRPS